MNIDSRFHIFNTHAEAEAAIRSLSTSGFDVKKLSLIGKVFRSDESTEGFYMAGERIKTWGGSAADWNDLCGVSFGPTVFFLPGLGFMAIAGPFIARLMNSLDNVAPMIGLTPLGAALAVIGVNTDQAIQYEIDLAEDKYLLLVHGYGNEVAKAGSVLGAGKALAAA